MTLHDGYGESVEVEDPELLAAELIRSNWAPRMCRALVWTLSRDLAADVDDFTQEARLEMWRTLPRWSGDGQVIPFLKQNARWRVMALIKGDHNFTGQERKVPVTQRRGDETRAKIKSSMDRLRTELGRTPVVREIAADLGLPERGVYKQMKNLHHQPTEARVHVSSLDEWFAMFSYDSDANPIMELLATPDVIDQIVLAYHYGEIHQAVADLSPEWREYVFLRFWCGTTDRVAAEEVGLPPMAFGKIKPVLADRLNHLVGAV